MRLKNWAKPDNVDWKKASENEKKLILPWFRGQEWYVLPSRGAGLDEPSQIHTVTIHEQTYYWWSLHHKLVWSNYMTFGKRRGSSAQDWLNAPSVTLINFNTKLIYPRTNIGFYPHLTDTTPHMLKDEVMKGNAAYALHNTRHNHVNDYVDVSTLRINTPPARDSDYEYDTGTDELMQRAPRYRIDKYSRVFGEENVFTDCIAVSILMIMILASIGLYTFIGMTVLGY